MVASGNLLAVKAEVERVRRFNRFYTRRIGVLEDGLLDTPFSLTEARVLFEVAQAGETTATRLREVLGVDAGYLSRVVRRLERWGLLERRRSERDGRQRLVALTPHGDEAFAELDGRTAEQTATMLASLSGAERRALVEAMTGIERLLDGAAAVPAPSSVELRPPRSGELGWVVHRHGAVYAEQYGWDASFEALVARVVAEYAAGHDPARERVWIADADGSPVGSVFCVDAGGGTAKLRLLLVEPSARGRGVGERLVAECVGFARAAGYADLVLWTQRVLAPARRIYERAGFVLVDEEHVDDRFGVPQVSETWRLGLGC